ncbi:hypothetical protein [Photobacterium damselae]|uniref:hypothetical protein n=1 Tax=Photobacterium damselae TaxID=38293 RepID=UPI001F3AC182|nr:hypothetical protein [Photobacterium damselae]UKA04821.1 hypothetical protein IHC89_21500 [Photobacterium damselae subsp. damselae]
MAILFTKEEAVKDLPFIEDKALYKGIDLALWLYLDKHWSFKNAVNKAAEKHSVKPKIAIERLLRQVVPEEVIWDRMSGIKPRNAQPASKETAIRGQKMKEMEKDSKNHVVDITRR